MTQLTNLCYFRAFTQILDYKLLQLIIKTSDNLVNSLAGRTRLSRGHDKGPIDSSQCSADIYENREELKSAWLLLFLYQTRNE